MQVININKNDITILFSRDEWSILYRAMVEPLLGFGLDISRTAWSHENALLLLEKIEFLYKNMDSSELNYTFSTNEFLFLLAMHSETIQHHGFPEYHTLTGHSFNAAQKLLAEMERVVVQ